MTLNHVVEHLHDPAGVLRRIAAILRPGGTLWIATPNLHALGHRRYGPDWLALDPPRHLVLFHRPRWSRCCAHRVRGAAGAAPTPTRRTRSRQRGDPRRRPTDAGPRHPRARGPAPRRPTSSRRGPAGTPRSSSCSHAVPAPRAEPRAADRYRGRVPSSAAIGRRVLQHRLVRGPSHRSHGATGRGPGPVRARRGLGRDRVVAHRLRDSGIEVLSSTARWTWTRSTSSSTSRSTRRRPRSTRRSRRSPPAPHPRRGRQHRAVRGLGARPLAGRDDRRVRARPANAALHRRTIERNGRAGRGGCTRRPRRATTGPALHDRALRAGPPGRRGRPGAREVAKVDVLPGWSRATSSSRRRGQRVGDPRRSAVRRHDGARALALEYHPDLCPSGDARAAAVGLLEDAGFSGRGRPDPAPPGYGSLWAWRSRLTGRPLRPSRAARERRRRDFAPPRAHRSDDACPPSRPSHAAPAQRRAAAPPAEPLLGVPLAITDYERTLDWIDARRGDRRSAATSASRPCTP